MARPTGRANQIDLLADLAGARVVSRAALPPARPGRAGRVRQLLGSVIGYGASVFAPGMVITGDGLAYGTGEAMLAQRIGFGAFLAHLLRKKPIVFTRRDDADAYSALAERLDLRPGAPINAMLSGNSCFSVAGTHCDGAEVFVHLGRGAGATSVHRHARGLAAAQSVLRGTAWQRFIATPVVSREVGDIAIFVETRVPGQRRSIHDVPAAELAAVLTQVAAPLIDLHRLTATATATAAAHAGLIGRFEADMARIEDGDLREALRQLTAETADWLRRRCPAAVLMHGDCCIQNFLFADGYEVAGVIDWEWARTDGCAGLDAVRLGIWSVADFFHLEVSALAADLAFGQPVPPALDAYLGQVIPALGLTAADIAPLATLQWLTMMFVSGVWTPAPDGGWMQRMARPMLRHLTDRR